MTDSRDEHEPYGITPAVEDADIVPWLRCEADSAAHHPSPWMMLTAAADIIERLRAERDEARRLICNIVSTACSRWSEDVAKDRGWEYLFKEDGK